MPAAAGPVVGEGDQRGLAIGALRDRRERAHPAREHARRGPRPPRSRPSIVGRELPRVLAERRRIEVVRRDGSADRARGSPPRRAAPPRRPAGSSSPAPETSRRSIAAGACSASCRCGLGLVALVAVVAEDRALDEGARDAVGRSLGDLPAERPRGQLPGALGRHRGCDAGALGNEISRPAEPDREPAHARRVRHRERLERATGLARGEQLADLRRRVRGGVASLEDADRDRVRAALGAALRGRGDVHRAAR